MTLSASATAMSTSSTALSSACHSSRVLPRLTAMRSRRADLSCATARESEGAGVPVIIRLPPCATASRRP